MAKVDLGQQVGPLPLGAWIAVVGGGLGLAWYSRRQGDTGPPEIVEDVSGEPGVGTGPGWIAVPPPSGAPNAPTPTTNEEWARQGINYLIAQGYDANVADSAVRKYMEALSLSVQEYALIRIVLNKFGAPPVPLPPGPDAPVVPPTTQPPATTQPSSGTNLTAPTNVRVLSWRVNTVTFTWDPVPGALWYETWLNVSGGIPNNYWVPRMTNVGTLSISIHDDGQASVMIRAANTSGKGPAATLPLRVPQGSA